MTIREGGTVEQLAGTGRIKSISIQAREHDYVSDLWINGTSLSYLTLEELIALRDECNSNIKKITKV